MGQYQPQHKVGERGRDGRVRFAEIGRRPGLPEMEAAFAAGRRAGLWRFDVRRPHRLLA